MNIEALQVSLQQGDEGRVWGNTGRQTDANTFGADQANVPGAGGFYSGAVNMVTQAAFEGANRMPPVEDMQEQDAKRLRRKLNNRESARRSRQKKADEINRLQELVSQKDAELKQCKQAVTLLQVHARNLLAKVAELGGSVDDPALLQALCAAPAETRITANIIAGNSQLPAEMPSAQDSVPESGQGS